MITFPLVVLHLQQPSIVGKRIIIVAKMVYNTGSCGLQLHCALVIRFGKSRYNKRESHTLWGRMYEIERKSHRHFCLLDYFKKIIFLKKDCQNTQTWRNMRVLTHFHENNLKKRFNSKVGPKI